MGPEKVKCPNCGKVNNVPAAGGEGKPRCGNCHQSLPWIAAAGGDGDFPEVAEKSSVPVLVDLWATWCAPCRMVSPALEQLATERAGQIKLVKVDVDAAPQMAERFTVRAVPTLLVMNRGGEVLARQAGAARFASCARGWMRHSRKMQTRTLNHDLCSSGGPTRDRHPGRHAPPDPPAGLRGMSSPRHPVGASAPLPDVRTRRLLRLLARQARKRTRSRHRPSDRPVAGTR